MAEQRIIDEGGVHINPKRPRPLGRPEGRPIVSPPIVNKPEPTPTQGDAPAPVVDTITKPPTNGGTTPTATPQTESFNWGGLLLVVGGLWFISQLGKDD
jgi:hypothetical protein